MLPAESVENNTALNFLSPEIAEYVDARVPEVLAQGGTLEADRLRRNMLSSMPMCFNTFGYLRQHPSAAARVLSEVFSLDIAVLENVDVEWSPPGEHPLGDRTAFDAFIEYRTSTNRRGFLGIETKYTEPFSQRQYDRPRYREITESPGSGFRPSAADTLRCAATNQLWRNALLVLAVRDRFGYDLGHVAVLATEGDRTASDAVQGLTQQLLHPGKLITSASFEALVRASMKQPELTDWAVGFQRRYLDLQQCEEIRL